MKRPNGIVPKPARGLYAKVGVRKRKRKVPHPPSKKQAVKNREEYIAWVDKVLEKRRLRFENAQRYADNNPRQGPRILPDLTKEKS